MRRFMLLWVCGLALTGCASRPSIDKAQPGQRANQSALTIELLGFEGCPNMPQTKANVVSAVAAIGLDAKVVYVDVMTLLEGDPRRGWHSPTVLVNGRDLFGMEKPKGTGTGCRSYPGGAPSEAEIIDALRAGKR